MASNLLAMASNLEAMAWILVVLHHLIAQSNTCSTPRLPESNWLGSCEGPGHVSSRWVFPLPPQRGLRQAGAHSSSSQEHRRKKERCTGNRRKTIENKGTISAAWFDLSTPSLDSHDDVLHLKKIWIQETKESEYSITILKTNEQHII